ncbi:MAG TPA: PfkB family carbohydrate kinase [Chthonomonadaceae bacterium]|nr:PfkB family carbohydrate kinase [Chthonomonadaceae bacterium]
MTRDIDVVVYGTVCLDLMWRVERLAAAGTYESILEERRTIGGEAANSAIALARWGLKVALVGTATGDDNNGRLLRALFAEHAPEIDLTGVEVAPGEPTAYCVCIATPDGHRTMYGSGFVEMQCPALDPALARRARMFTMDPNAYRAGLEACAVAAAAGAEIVAMDYTGSPEVNRAAAISVTSETLTPGAGSLKESAAYAGELRDREGGTTIVTCGERGCFAAERGTAGVPAVHYPALRPQCVVDTTGAGDIFRAGLIYGRIQGWPLDRTVRFASAAAALNCAALGGWAGVRPLAEIDAFQRAADTIDPGAE